MSHKGCSGAKLDYTKRMAGQRELEGHTGEALDGIPAPRPCILFVDDEGSVRRIGERALTNAGFEVLPARDGVEALEIFQTEHARISLVVLDMTMPRMSGPEAFAAMQAIDVAVPVLLSTGFHCEESVAELGGNGPAGVIQKPYRLATLVDTVRSALLPPR